MNKLLKHISIFSLFFWLWGGALAFSQCPMCKAAVESASGNTELADGLNTGILYMFILPYLMIMGIGILWYRGYRKKKAAQADE